jgi:secreted trypsin-like serine protease
MWKFLVIAIIIALSQSCRVIEEKANGITSERDSNSGFVLIEAYNGFETKYLCSGVLISPQFVLTSANCVFGTTFVNVHVYAYKLRDQFEENREIHRINSTDILFNEYNGFDHINDIALIPMPAAFSLSGKTYLNIANIPTSALTEGNQGDTIGWGLLKYSDDNAAALKQQLSLTVISEADCRNAYPTLNWSGGALGRVCVKRTSTGTNCVSDSGSPFLSGGMVRGLQSHGQVEACDNQNMPNLIQDVFVHIDWIKSVTGLP